MKNVGALALGGLAAATAVVVLVSGTPTPAPASAVPSAVRGVEAPTASRTRPVRALGHLRVPDVLVTTRSPLSVAQVKAVAAVNGVQAQALLAQGRVTVAGRRLDVLGVNPSSVRAFTPRETALSDPLWASVARGELAAAYGTDLPLGAHVQLGSESVRVGAVAAFGLPGSDSVVGADVAHRLGLRDTGLLVSAPKRSLKGLERDLREILGKRADVTVLRPVSVVHRRPKTYTELYKLSARYCPGLSWTVLAAIGQVESGHGRNLGPSSAGALGPMQFLPSTWKFSGVDGDGDGKADVMSPYDSVPAAALYLCRAGAGRGGRGLYAAIYSYNHADWYVRKVLAVAEGYARAS